ncbi:hypothetical protein [Kroppenstedtia sanguinis]|uniref:Uncharacterized protein n=1 Tax=Kroppenstedtia sanguinis TaxID=1380684 RepID=A0ABW4C6N9_9BACL
MNRSRWVAGTYQWMLVLLTLLIPLLIYFASRGRGLESGNGTIGAVFAFVILLSYLVISNRRRR